MSVARRLLTQWAPAVRCPGELSVASQGCRGYAAEAALAEPMDTPEHEKDGKVLHPGTHPPPVVHTNPDRHQLLPLRWKRAHGQQSHARRTDLLGSAEPSLLQMLAEEDRILPVCICAQ